MRLSKPQVAMFWRLWAAACRSQGWLPERGVSREEQEDRRHDLLACLGFASLHDVDKTAGFDAVKAALLSLKDNVQGARESDHPEIGRARRYRHKIRTQILPCLALYVADPVAYATKIARERFGQAFEWRLDAMDPIDVEHCLFTLAARLDTHRRTAGDTVAEMLRRAKKLYQTSSTSAANAQKPAFSADPAPSVVSNLPLDA